MTNPQQYVADQIGQHAETVRGDTASPDDIAQPLQAQAGIGVTEADLDGIREQLAAFKAQLDAQAQAQRQATPDTLRSSVAALGVQLANHGDPAAIELGKDAAEAAENAAESGDTGALGNIIKRIEQHLRRHPNGPGEQFHYNQVLDTVAQHIPDVIEAFQPPSSDLAVTSSRAPAKVVAGSVVG